MSFNLLEKQAQAKRKQWVGTIESMLQNNADNYTALIKDETLQANLAKDRSETDPTGTEEARLEKGHSGTGSSTTEGQLNTGKGVFNELRNPTTGDVPKLEEKRLKEKPVENEKYKSAVE